MNQTNTPGEITSRIDQLVWDSMRWSGISKKEAVKRLRGAVPTLFEKLASFPEARTNTYLTKFK